jgi:hypothetical protein
VRYFGLVPVYDDPEILFAATPIGVPCQRCGEPIVAGDCGWLIPYHDGKGFPTEVPYHHVCHMRGIVGSVAHQQRRCSCYVPGATCGDDPKLTRRQAAEAALKFWQIARRLHI